MPEHLRLSRQECVDLLAANHFGRIAVADRDGLGIFPVNYTWSDGHLVIRTNRGSRVSHMAQREVAFEIDRVDDVARTGWSVLVVGVAYEVTDSVDGISAAIRDLPVDTLAPGEPGCWLRIEPGSVTGRRIPGAVSSPPQGLESRSSAPARACRSSSRSAL